MSILYRQIRFELSHSVFSECLSSGGYSSTFSDGRRLYLRLQNTQPLCFLAGWCYAGRDFPSVRVGGQLSAPADWSMLKDRLYDLYDHAPSSLPEAERLAKKKNARLLLAISTQLKNYHLCRHGLFWEANGERRFFLVPCQSTDRYRAYCSLPGQAPDLLLDTPNGWCPSLLCRESEKAAAPFSVLDSQFFTHEDLRRLSILLPLP